jgi:hypothetical protein
MSLRILEIRMKPTDQELIAFLVEAKRGHYYCEDCWYSCPKAAEGCCDESQGTDCNCGADEWNAKVDAMIARLEPQEDKA